MSAPLSDLLERSYRYALALTHNEVEAAALLKQSWGELLRMGHERTFERLAGIIRCQTRMRGLHLHLVLPGDEHAPAEPWATDDESVRATRGLTAQTLSGMRPEEREALYLTWMERYDCAALARHTERPPGAIRRLYERARQRFQAGLSRAGVRQRQ